MLDDHDNEKVIKLFPYKDERLNSLLNVLDKEIYDRCAEQGISIVSIIGVLEALKKNLLHELEVL